MEIRQQVTLMDIHAREETKLFSARPCKQVNPAKFIVLKSCFVPYNS